ncbi:MAG: C4-type zinc ribbon domain-containing protein [Candidatus Eisenbacteria bacterium]
MNDELRHFWALRSVDDEAARLASDLGRLPALRRAHEVRIGSMHRALRALDERAEAALKSRRSLERDIAAFDAQEKHFEHQLSAVTDQKQYEAVRHEIAAVRAKRSDVETSALECLEVEERCSAERPALAATWERATLDSVSANADWDAEAATARARGAELDAHRERLALLLPAASRSQYERLRHARDGRAVAVIENGACGACFYSLSPHAAQEARKRDRMVACDGCGRLLMFAPDGHAD